MPLPLTKNKLLRCPNCDSEDLQPKRNAEHLVVCEVCHRTWDVNVVENLLNAKQTNSTN